MQIFSGGVRRPLVVELGAEDQSLARRWAIALPSFYSAIVVVIIAAAVLASSGADKTTVVTRPDKIFLQDRSSVRPYGALPNIGQSILACRDSQRCVASKANGIGEEK